MISRETDPYKLGKMGMIFLRVDNNTLAFDCFKKAGELEPGWRDAWLWKGYTELKLSQPKNALASLKKAETIDPIYPLTYQLLAISYQQTDDPNSAKGAQEKLTYLSKSYNQ